ncbi:MAG: toll/interleukin-1 receptor domain-containing protein [Armatimonadetes bacterium]|nr:toll/interleukin-1 receptor domain-containing protein [Armatimonadota bacterium]
MRVFISHSHADDALAYQVAETLKQSGFDVWDERQILPGENWAARVGDALERSEAMVVLLTPAGLRSKEVNSEIGYALGNRNYSGRVISVLAGPPDEVSQDDVPWILRRLRMIRLPEAPSQNMESLGQIADALAEATPALAPAH